MNPALNRTEGLTGTMNTKNRDYSNKMSGFNMQTQIQYNSDNQSLDTSTTTSFAALPKEVVFYNFRRALRSAFVLELAAKENVFSPFSQLILEQISWSEETTAEELAGLIIFTLSKQQRLTHAVANNIKSSLEYAYNTIDCFMSNCPYYNPMNFLEALSMVGNSAVTVEKTAVYTK